MAAWRATATDARRTRVAHSGAGILSRLHTSAAAHPISAGVPPVARAAFRAGSVTTAEILSANGQRRRHGGHRLARIVIRLPPRRRVGRLLHRSARRLRCRLLRCRLLRCRWL